MWNITVTYASAIKVSVPCSHLISKQYDPTIQLMGPVVSPFCPFFFSPADGCQIGADLEAHIGGNNELLLQWFASQVSQYNTNHGVQLLDYLDIHYSPESSSEVRIEMCGNNRSCLLCLQDQASRMQSIENFDIIPWDHSMIQRKRWDLDKNETTTWRFHWRCNVNEISMLWFHFSQYSSPFCPLPDFNQMGRSKPTDHGQYR